MPTYMTQLKSTDVPTDPTSRGLIHLVEPCLPLLEILVIHLMDEGYDVMPFASHRIAFDDFAAASPRPRLLITNYGSGGFSGVDLAINCLEIEPTVKVILCSGRPDIPEKITASPSSFRFLPKPFPLPVLDFTIQSLLGGAYGNVFGRAHHVCGCPEEEGFGSPLQ
jgi:DNA-binding NtrC family response regulator